MKPLVVVVILFLGVIISNFIKYNKYIVDYDGIIITINHAILLDPFFQRKVAGSCDNISLCCYPSFTYSSSETSVTQMSYF